MTGKILVLLAAFCGVTWAQPALPQTPVGKVLAKWMEAFNSGDKAKMLAYMEVHEPKRKDNVDRMLDFRENTGGFTLLRIGDSEERKLQVFVKEKTGDDEAELQIAVDEADPPVVTSLRLQVVPADKATQRPVRLSETEALAGLEKEAAAREAKDTFSGSLLVGKNGKVLLQNAYGLADREKNIPATIDTRYRIGSMNKMFTSVAALQLVEAGKLSLDKPIGEYLKDYPNEDVASKVTLRHLLSHTGGTGDIFGPEFEKNRLQLRTLEDYVNLYGSRALKFEPGSKWEYSNYGFLLTGVLIAKASGMSYYDYVREKVFKPAGMTRTDSQPENQKVEQRSVGYIKDAGKWKPNTDTLPYRGTSAGGGYSTVGDLFQFAQALESGKLISKDMLRQATSKQNRTGSGPDYGFGFQAGGDGSYGHGGGAPGMNGDLKIFPESGYVVVVLANLDPPAAGRLAGWFANRMPK